MCNLPLRDKADLSKSVQKKKTAENVKLQIIPPCAVEYVQHI